MEVLPNSFHLTGQILDSRVIIKLVYDKIILMRSFLLAIKYCDFSITADMVRNRSRKSNEIINLII